MEKEKKNDGVTGAERDFKWISLLYGVNARWSNGKAMRATGTGRSSSVSSDA